MKKRDHKCHTKRPVSQKGESPEDILFGNVMFMLVLVLSLATFGDVGTSNTTTQERLRQKG